MPNCKQFTVLAWLKMKQASNLDILISWREDHMMALPKMADMEKFPKIL